MTVTSEVAQGNPWPIIGFGGGMLFLVVGGLVLWLHHHGPGPDDHH